MINKLITAISIVVLASTLTYAGACCKASGGTCCKPKTEVKSDAKAQATCPVMKGNAISKDLYVDAEGKRIYVCCNSCVETVKADPKKYIAELEATGVVLEISPM